MGLNLGTGLGGSGLVDLAFATGLGGSGLNKVGGDPNEAVIDALSPVAWYKFDDGAGTILTDYSGNGRNGTLGTSAAAPTWVSEGLSFDGGDTVTLGTLPIIQGIDLVFLPDSAISAATSQGKLVGFGNGGGVGDSGIAFGAFFNILTNEIIGIKQQTADGFSAQAGRAYAHASNTVSSAWHLLQCDLISSQWTVTIDGTDLSNHQGVNAPVEFPSGPWAFGSNASTSSQNFTGDIAYGIFYGTARSTAQQAAVRTALTAIMAARGVSLP